MKRGQRIYESLNRAYFEEEEELYGLPYFKDTPVTVTSQSTVSRNENSGAAKRSQLRDPNPGNEVLTDSSIDEKVSWRTIQKMIGAEINGNKNDPKTQEKLTENGWTSDELILENAFIRTAGQSIDKQSDYIASLQNPAISPALTKALENATAAHKMMMEGETLFFLHDMGKAAVAAINEDKIIAAISQVFDLRLDLTSKLEESGAEEVQKQNLNFGVPDIETGMQLISNLKSRNSKVYGALTSGQPGQSMEALVKVAYYEMLAAEAMLPEELQRMGNYVPVYKKSQKEWKGHKQYEVKTKQGDSISVSWENFSLYRNTSLAKVIDELKQYYDSKRKGAAAEANSKKGTDEDNKKAEAKNAEIYMNNASVNMANISIYIKNYAIELSDLALIYMHLAEGYLDLIAEIVKYSSTEFKDKITQARKDQMGNSSDLLKFQQLIELVRDYMNVDLQTSNIFSIHYDERVDKISPSNPVESLFKNTSNKPEFSNGATKIMSEGKLLGVILFEKGNLKVIKLGVAAFDNWKLMQKAIQLAVDESSPKLNRTKLESKQKDKFLKEKENGEYDPQNASVVNNNTFTDKRSVRIILDVLGAPRADTFTAESSDWIYSWQLKGVFKPENEKKGVLRFSDVNMIYQALTNGSATGYNAAIILTLDYYNLNEKALSLPTSLFQLPEGDYGDLTIGEVYLTMYYKEDALEKSDREAAATIGGGAGVSPYIKMGVESFGTMQYLSDVLSHELIHARQDLGAEVPSAAKEIYAYYVNISRSFGADGSEKLPRQEKLSTYAHALRMATEYFLEFTDVEDLVNYSPKMLDFITEASLRIGEYVPTEKNKAYNEAEFKKNLKNAITYETDNNILELFYQAIIIYETSDILKALLNFVKTLANVQPDKGLISKENVEIVIGQAFLFTQGKWISSPENSNFSGKLHLEYQEKVLDPYYDAVRKGVGKYLLTVIDNLDLQITGMPEGKEKVEFNDVFKRLKEVTSVINTK